MKYCYANRHHTLYPEVNEKFSINPDSYNDAFLGKVAEIGFEGLELNYQIFDSFDDDSEIKAFGKRLEGAGTPAVAIRAGGSLTSARGYAENVNKLTRLIDVAELMGTGVVNGSLSSPQRRQVGPARSRGLPVSQDASRDAMIYDYERIADELRKGADRAAPKGIKITVEVHHNSLVDNSWSAKLVNNLVDRANFGINPDLGNVLWAYDEPEEPTETTIAELAPISLYWHCKNQHRINHPENERSVYFRVALQDGEIDYRFAISAMVDADYDGYMAIEGAPIGDQFYDDQKSLSYAKGIVAELEG
jgi:sugar phosphate isomerase/epimerase